MRVAIIQARMGSTRLPGKVLMDIAGEPMLWHVYDRVSKSSRIDRVVIATSTAATDDPIEDFCKRRSIFCFRGNESDVLDRFYRAAEKFEADSVVRITADCPLIDPFVIDRVVQEFESNSLDYAANNFVYSYPDGLDVEVFSIGALKRAFQEAKKWSEREHVTPFIRSSDGFKTANVTNDKQIPGDNLRWTVDGPDDLAYIRRLYEAAPRGSFLVMQGWLDLLEQKPTLRQSSSAVINEGYYVSLMNRSVHTESKIPPTRALSQSRHWHSRSEKVIPGCAQTFSKGTSQYVQGVAPIFLQKGMGSHVWDVDGNEYIDYVQGLLPNILGYAHPKVNEAMKTQIDAGISFSLPHPLEVELAERLKEIIPSAEMVRFGKNGSDVTSGAVRVARAFTGRNHIACSGYHGWQDWYIGTTQRNLGVPGQVAELTHAFKYNELESLEKIFSEFPNSIAAVIMEPVNFTAPKAGFLESTKSLAHRNGALFIFDEMCTGFHFGLGGAQKKFGVTPDLACFGKAMGNGYPISCVVGRRDVMKLFDDVFFSFTFAGDVLGFAAALKVLDILGTSDALARIEEHGRMIKDGFNVFSKKTGLEHRLSCVGYPNWTLIKFMNESGQDSFLEKSLFQQEALRRGLLLLSTHNLTAAHSLGDIESTLEIYADVFHKMAHFLSDKNPSRYLEGSLIQPVFKVR